MKKGCSHLLGLLTCLLCILLSGCDQHREVVSHIGEKEANVVLVLLESRHIPASKRLSTGLAISAQDAAPKYTILVSSRDFIEAVAILNQNGFPRSKGADLLDLFAKQGLMSSDKEESIRYQAGLAQQLTNTLLMIDGVIDARVHLSFPTEEEKVNLKEQAVPSITASVYVKHQSSIDDPNLHLETKVKRLISGSVSGLDINHVTVVLDRSRFTDISLGDMGELIGVHPQEYVKIWSMVINKQSIGRFRFLFFSITMIAILLAITTGWFIWKFYPSLKKKGAIREFLSPTPWASIKQKWGQKSSQSSDAETPP